MTSQCKWPITKRGRSKSCLRKESLNRPCHLRIRLINTRTSLSRDVYSQLNFHFSFYADIQTYLLFCFSCNFSSNSLSSLCLLRGVGCELRLQFIKTVEVTHCTLTLKYLLFSLKHIPEVYGLSSQVIEQFCILIRQDET